MVGAGALAVDLSQFRLAQNRLQSAADAAALAAVQRIDEPEEAVAEAVTFARRNVPDTFGTVAGEADVAVGIYDPESGTFTPGGGADANAVRVITVRSTERGNGVPRALGLIFGREGATVSAMAIAARQQHLFYEAPESVSLPPDAGDFNEMYAYCFDYKGGGSAESRRSQMTLIANNDPSGAAVAAAMAAGVPNVGPVPNPVTWPECGEGESLSFRMRNIRHAKSFPDLWANPAGRSFGRPEWNYFTDTEIINGVEHFALTEAILETIRCDSEACETELADGTIPNNQKHRDPIRDARPCMPGKYMYFGWEDRPPGRPGASSSWTDPAWTDRDYDDIRIVMKCPERGMLGDGMTRLVR
jgi:hypothetical protein